jgi:hypothetical protein
MELVSYLNDRPKNPDSFFDQDALPVWRLKKREIVLRRSMPLNIAPPHPIADSTAAESEVQCV